MPERRVKYEFFWLKISPHCVNLGKEDNGPVRQYIGNSIDDGALALSVTTAFATVQNCDAQLRAAILCI